MFVLHVRIYSLMAPVYMYAYSHLMSSLNEFKTADITNDNLCTSNEEKIESHNSSFCNKKI